MSRIPFHPFSSLLHPAWLLIPLLVFTAWAYSPGLTGKFLLDDFQNLSDLAAIDSTGAQELLTFIESGHAGPSRRPISLLSFALQAPYWTSEPAAFKHANIAIHLICGALIFWLFYLVGMFRPQYHRQALWLALGTSAVWLLHPIQVSTTLYVIQRMTQLAALFVFAGLIGYLKGRLWMESGRTIKGWFLAFGSLGFFGVLATLSKENGYFIFLYALALEILLQTPRSRSDLFQRSRVPLLLAPILLLVIYVALNADSVVFHDYGVRNFTLGERLLTEARVIFVYLTQILVPGHYPFTLYHDDYLVSRGLLTPWTTLPSVIGIVALVVIAIHARTRVPVLSFGIAWFLFGHLLEGTVIPLELYFEHRNYLPLVGPAYTLCWMLYRLYDLASTRAFRRLVPVLAAGWLLVLSVFTINQTVIWGKPLLQASMWALKSPDSLRAVTAHATELTLAGRLKEAEDVYRHLVEKEPEDANAYLFWLRLSCFSSSVTAPGSDRIEEVVSAAPFSYGVIQALVDLKDLKAEKECERVTLDELINITRALITNPGYRDQEPLLLAILGHYYALQGRLNDAMTNLDKAFAQRPVSNIAIMQAEWLISAGLHEQAEEFLDKAEAALKDDPLTRMVYLPYIDRLRRANEKDAKQSGHRDVTKSEQRESEL